MELIFWDHSWIGGEKWNKVYTEYRKRFLLLALCNNYGIKIIRLVESSL